MPGLNDPVGERAATRTRKPTETHLDRVIAQYRREYTSAARDGVDAVVKYARERGRDVELLEARGIFLRHLSPIRAKLRPHVDLAVRLGASRIPDLEPRQVDAFAARIVPEVDKQRAKWLTKMSGDFVQRVLATTLALGGAAAVAWSLLHKDDPARGVDPAALDPSEFGTTDPQGVFVWSSEKLAELESRGYRFVDFRAVEATESDIWTGDDLGYLAGAQVAGIQRVEWRTSPDDLVCPICEALDGETFTLAEAESISADRAFASHCRCRCWFDSVDPTEGEA